MKTILIVVVLGFSALGFSKSFEVTKATAEVNRVSGYYLFIDSKPIQEYEYLGTVNVGVFSGNQFQDVRNSLIQKAKKKYPDGEGLIFNFCNGCTDKVDVIKFK